MTVARFKEEIIEYNFDGKFLKKCLEYLNDHRVLEELCSELIYDKFTNLEELIENYCNLDKIEIARAVYFGNIHSWIDDYFYFNGCGNIESQNEYQYYKDFTNNKKIIMNEMVNFVDKEDLEQVKNIEELVELIEYHIL